MANRKINILVAGGLLLLVITIVVALVSKDKLLSTDDCGSPLLLNQHYWDRSVPIQRTTLPSGHKVTVVSYDPRIKFSLQKEVVFASKLQELQFWDKEVLDTTTRPRQLVQPQHLCIIMSPDRQNFNTYYKKETDTIYQSTSTVYDTSSDTLKLTVNFNPDAEQQASLSSENLGFAVSYAVMSTLFGISTPSPINESDLAMRKAKEKDFLSFFKRSDASKESSIFGITYLDWSQNQ